MSQISQPSAGPVPGHTGAPLSEHTPHQILGPYFPATDEPAATNDLTTSAEMAGVAQGQIIWVEGRILNRAGEPVDRAKIVVWQANSFGRYAHPNDSNPAPLDPNFTGFAKMFSGPDGSYRFRTVKPGAYPAGPLRTRPPHIHFEVQGRFDRLITQMYFPNEPLNDRDPLLLSANAPCSLLARSAAPDTFTFDIVLFRG